MHTHLVLRNLLLGALLALATGNNALAHGDEAHAAEAANPPYDAATAGVRDLVLGPVVIRMLAEASNLGRDDIEVGELRLPADFGEGTAHQHGSLELFYVVEGVLGHEVNGVAHRLEPGMLGFVKPGDAVRHSVLSPGPMRAVVIWLPGGEADRLIEHAGFEARPLPGATSQGPE